MRNAQLCELTDPHVWSEAQVVTFFDHIRGHPMYAFLWLLGHTDMTVAQLCRLRWDHVDMGASLIWTCDRDHPRDGTPECVEARSVTLSPHATRVLHRWHLRQRRGREAWGSSYIDLGRTFTYESGRPYSVRYVVDTFQRLAREAGSLSTRVEHLRPPTPELAKAG
jgi:integrase